MMWCAMCRDEGHEAVDCENAKILMMQNRQQISHNKEICQLCETPGHSARTCRKMSNNQQNTFQNNSSNFADLRITSMNIELEIETDFYEQIIKMVISFQIIQMVIIEKTLMHNV